MFLSSSPRHCTIPWKTPQASFNPPLRERYLLSLSMAFYGGFAKADESIDEPFSHLGIPIIKKII